MLVISRFGVQVTRGRLPGWQIVETQFESSFFSVNTVDLKNYCGFECYLRMLVRCRVEEEKGSRITR